MPPRRRQAAVTPANLIERRIALLFVVFAGLILLAVEGIVMYAVFAWLEGRLTRWAFRSPASAAA